MDDKLFPKSPGAASFVAIGDSFTEGLNDAAPGGGFRGWADRLAGLLAAEYPPQADGKILLPYPRLFFIASKAG